MRLAPVDVLAPAVDPGLQLLGRERAAEGRDRPLAAARGEGFPGAQLLGLGHVVAGEARQLGEEVAA